MPSLVRYLEPKHNSDVKANLLEKTIHSIRSEINESDYNGYKWKGYSSDQNKDNNCLNMGQGEYCTCQWGATPKLLNGVRVCSHTNPFNKSHITNTSTGCSDDTEPVAWGKEGSNAQGFSCLRFKDDSDTFCGTGTKFDSGKCISTVDITSGNASMCGTGTKFDSGKCISTVDITSDNASMCGTGTKFDSGKCISTVDITSDNASMCGTGTKFDSGKCISTVDITSDNASMCGTGTKFDSGKCISTVDITSDNASMCGTGTKFDSGKCKVDHLHGTFLGRILDNALGTTKQTTPDDP